jgi:hypothetical protein
VEHRSGRGRFDAMFTRHRILIVPTLVVAALLSACGGGDEESATTTTEATVAFADWADDANQLCRAADTETEELPGPSGDDDYAGLEDLAVETRRIVDEFIDDVKALGTPDENASEVSDWLATYARFGEVLDELEVAAADQDDTAINAAIADGDELEAEQDELAESLGLDDCWEPEEAVEEGPADDADEAAFADWQTQTDDACAALNPQYNAINEMEPTDLASLAAYAAGLNAFMTSTVAEFDRIGPPPVESDSGQELYDLLSQMQTAAQDIVDAVEAEDVDAATSAAEQFDTLGAELNPIAEELGVPSCGGF